MSEIILICVVVMVFCLSYYIINHMNSFFVDNYRGEPDKFTCNSLRIAFEIPTLSQSISNILEQFSKDNISCNIHLLAGNTDEILEKINNCEIDFGLIYADSYYEPCKDYETILIGLEQMPLTLKDSALTVFPMDETETMVRIIWNKRNTNYYNQTFINLINAFLQKEI